MDNIDLSGIEYHLYEVQEETGKQRFQRNMTYREFVGDLVDTDARWQALRNPASVLMAGLRRKGLLG